MTYLIEIKIQSILTKLGLIALLLVAVIFQNTLGQTPDKDMVVTDGEVRAILVDGNYTYIGGQFATVGQNSPFLAKATSTNAKPDKTYPIPNNTVRASVPDGAGGWYIGGDFTAIGTTVRNRLAHINADGSLDASWNPNASSTVYSIAVSGTDIYVGGLFTTIGGLTYNKIARLNNTTGAADASWNPSASSTVYSIVVSGTYIYVGGAFATIGGVVYNRIARINNTTGVADASWNPNLDNTVYSIAESGNKIYIGGAFTKIGGVTYNRIARLNNITGAVDATWLPEASATVRSLVIIGTDLFVGGDFTTIGGLGRNRIAKLSTTGTGAADASWNPNADASVYSISVSGSDIYVGGTFITIGGQSRKRVAKLNNTDGLADASWDLGTNGIVNAIASNGTNILFGGGFTLTRIIVRNNIAKIDNTTGLVEPNWDPNINAIVYTLAISGSDIFVGGNFTAVKAGTVARGCLAKFSTTGTGVVDASWDPNLSGQVIEIAISGTDLFVGGSFTTVNGGTIRNRLAKFSTSGTGTVDPNWDPNIGATVYALAISGTDIYVGGVFTTVNSPVVTRKYAARFPTSGTGVVDATWNPNMNNVVNSICINGSDIYIGGIFTSVNGGTVRNGIAKVNNTDGTAEAAWNPNANTGGGVYSIVINGSEMYLGGGFTKIGLVSRNRLAKLNLDGTLTTWDPNASSTIQAIAVSGTDVYVGGAFTTMGGLAQPSFALFTDRVLPVELVFFTASVTKGLVKLNWETATEVDNHGFDVERAIAGSNDWQKIGFSEGYSTTNSPKYYSFTDNPSAVEANKYKYRLKQMDNSGSFEYSNIVEVSLGTPENFILEQNYPNPFNPSTVIRYQLPVSGTVSIDLYNLTGEKVTTLLNKTEEAGVHSISFDATKHGLASGIYFYRMTVVSGAEEVFSSVRKLSLLK